MEFIQITNEERSLLNSLEPTYERFIEQKDEEREFLFALIAREKPKKVLEVGVSSGASSVLLLHALSTVSPKTLLYSVDYSKQWYINSEHQTGFIIHVYPQFKKNWKLYLGGVVAESIDEIGKDIDFVFLDTSHCLPGEILDFLMILPYLKDDCLLVVHDVNLQTVSSKPVSFVNNILMNCISSPKILPLYASSFHTENKDGELFNSKHIIYKDNGFLYSELLKSNTPRPFFTFPNIAAVRINQNLRDNIYNFFNALALPWEYIPPQKDFDIMKEHFKKHYDPFYCNMFETSYHYAKFKQSFNENIEK